MSANTINIYKPIKARVESVIEESPTIKTLVLEPQTGFSFKTGQFIELTLNGYGEAPFTPSSSPLEKDKVEITIMKTGYITEKFHQVSPGTILGLRGPFGNGYPLEKFRDKEILIISGGCGLAPIRSLLYSLEAMSDEIRKVSLCYGSKTPADCIYKPLFARLNQIPKFETFRTVDQADHEWTDSVGVVTVLLDKVKINLENTIAVVCGPKIMMKFTTIRLIEFGFSDDQIILSMEKNMSCGVGKGGHCMLGEFFVCKDGPVFTYTDLKNIADLWK